MGTLLAVLDEPTPEMRRLRALLAEGGRFPSAGPGSAPAGGPGHACRPRSAAWAATWSAVLDPWADAGGRRRRQHPLRARGGVWHKKHREAGVVPHTTIDTEAHWTKSGWHGWVYGWKLHLASPWPAVWIPWPPS